MDDLTRQHASPGRHCEWPPARTYGDSGANKIMRADTAVLRIECEPSAATLHRLWKILESEGVSPLTIDIQFPLLYVLVEMLVPRRPATTERSMLQALRRVMAIRRADLLTDCSADKSVEPAPPLAAPPGKAFSTRLLRLFNG